MDNVQMEIELMIQNEPQARRVKSNWLETTSLGQHMNDPWWHLSLFKGKTLIWQNVMNGNCGGILWFSKDIMSPNNKWSYVSCHCHYPDFNVCTIDLQASSHSLQSRHSKLLNICLQNRCMTIQAKAKLTVCANLVRRPSICLQCLAKVFTPL